MDSECFISWLKAQRGVVRVEVMDDRLVKRIVEEEATVSSAFGTPVDNSGLRDCVARNSIFVAFVDVSFWNPAEPSMYLKNGEGEIIGFEIPSRRAAEFQGRDDLMFLNDDFAIYTCKGMNDTLVMEMVSLAYVGEDGSIPEEAAAVIWYPSPTSSDIIHETFGQPNGSLATAMIALNLDTE